MLWWAGAAAMSYSLSKDTFGTDIDTKDNPYFAPSDGRCLINDLPAELLSQIFILGAQYDPEVEAEDLDDECDSCCSGHSLSDDESDTGSQSSQKSYGSHFERHLPFELLVTRICKRWREVAVEIPTLWSNIVFQDPFNLEKAEEYVRRAKGAPLDISIDCTVEEDEMLDDEGEQLNEETMAERPEYLALVDILKLLRSHLEQWKSFELAVSHYLLMQHALKVLATCPNALALESLALYHYEESEESDHFPIPGMKGQDFVLFGNNVPKLKEVALWGVHLNWERTTFLSGLRDIELAYHALDVRPSYRDFLRILKSSPELHTLTLCQSGPAGMPVEWLESMRQGADGQVLPDTTSDALLSISVPSIENLVLAFLPPDYVLALLDRIHIPNVTSLALDFDQDEYTPVINRLAEPVAGSSKPLLAGIEALKLSGLPCSHVPTLVKAANALQSLKQLSVNFTHVDELWLDLLMAPEPPNPYTPLQVAVGGAMYFPRLEAVSITALDGMVVRDLVRVRKANGKPLKEVYLNKDEVLEEEDEVWLKENLDVFELFEGSDDEDVDDLGDVLDLDDVDEEDVIEDDQDDEWTDEDEEEFDDDFDDDDAGFDYVVHLD
jgi:hypothetical protein